MMVFTGVLSCFSDFFIINIIIKQQVIDFHLTFLIILYKFLCDKSNTLMLCHLILLRYEKTRHMRVLQFFSIRSNNLFIPLIRIFTVALIAAMT